MCVSDVNDHREHLRPRLQTEATFSKELMIFIKHINRKQNINH